VGNVNWKVAPRPAASNGCDPPLQGFGGGGPTTDTVLTASNAPINAPIEKTFNDNFGPLGHTSRVPVTRIDISGFGESLFSDWKNPGDGAELFQRHVSM
jgi:hypothetical protein